MLDFGVAKLRGDQSLPQSDKLTSVGAIIGTAPYMAPEQWHSRQDIDGRADIYALGVILFEMLCGRRPYTANSAYEWIALHMEATPPVLTAFGVSAPLNRVVRRMLSRQPELRPQTMREVIQDLRTASRGLRNIAALTGETDHHLPQGAAAPTAVGAPPASYPQPPASYAQPPVRAGANPVAPPMHAPPMQPPVQMIQPPSPPGQWLRRIGELGFLLLVFGIYAAWNWRETTTWVRSFIANVKSYF